MTFYIQRKVTQHRLETVDQFQTRLEALRMLKVYQKGEPTVTFYVSRTPCSTWKNRRIV